MASKPSVGFTKATASYKHYNSFGK